MDPSTVEGEVHPTAVPAKSNAVGVGAVVDEPIAASSNAGPRAKEAVAAEQAIVGLIDLDPPNEGMAADNHELVPEDVFPDHTANPFQGHNGPPVVAWGFLVEDQPLMNNTRCALHFPKDFREYAPPPLGMLAHQVPFTPESGVYTTLLGFKDLVGHFSKELVAAV